MKKKRIPRRQIATAKALARLVRLSPSMKAQIGVKVMSEICHKNKECDNDCENCIILKLFPFLKDQLLGDD